MGPTHAWRWKRRQSYLALAGRTEGAAPVTPLTRCASGHTKSSMMCSMRPPLRAGLATSPHHQTTLHVAHQRSRKDGHDQGIFIAHRDQSREVDGVGSAHGLAAEWVQSRRRAGAPSGPRSLPAKPSDGGGHGVPPAIGDERRHPHQRRRAERDDGRRRLARRPVLRGRPGLLQHARGRHREHDG